MRVESAALGDLPEGMRAPLLDEYTTIVQNYMERRWGPSEMAAGRFCEIVYTILEGYASGSYPGSPQKPRDFVGACRSLEANTQVPRSFQILIPRVLPALYEVRNNRGVGHVGGDVSSNGMDAAFVIRAASWVMAELVRVLHDLPADVAQRLVDRLAEPRIPLVWVGDDVRRVLRTDLALKDQVLVLLASTLDQTETSDLFKWTGYGKKPYFMRVLRSLHASRMVELSDNEVRVEILPPGVERAVEVLESWV